MPANPPAIQAASTSLTAFIGVAHGGPLQTPTAVASFAQYQTQFGGLSADSALSFAVRQFFANGGNSLVVIRTPSILRPNIQKSLQALASSPVNLLALPGVTDSAILADAASFCQTQRCFLIVDTPPTTTTAEQLTHWIASSGVPKSAWAAAYAPRLQIPDPLGGSALLSIAASGTIAGVLARNDANLGVWKAIPAGAALLGISQLTNSYTDAQASAIEAAGINAIRFAGLRRDAMIGNRTLGFTSNPTDPTWQYVPVRRLSLFLEQSVAQGLKWVTFEPNGPILWQNIRQSVSNFLQSCFRQGAFQGTTPSQAYFVKCDASTTTQADIANGVVKIVIGFAPLKPAEFVLIQISAFAANPPAH